MLEPQGQTTNKLRFCDKIFKSVGDQKLYMLRVGDSNLNASKVSAMQV